MTFLQNHVNKYICLLYSLTVVWRYNHVVSVKNCCSQWFYFIFLRWLCTIKNMLVLHQYHQLPKLNENSTATAVVVYLYFCIGGAIVYYNIYLHTYILQTWGIALWLNSIHLKVRFSSSLLSQICAQQIQTFII